MSRSTTLTSDFTGFPEEVFTFLEGLEADNSRTYWQAHKPIWEDVVQRTVHALMAELEPDFGPLRTFRPQRDVRFSADKTPYKTWVGITTSDRAVGGIGSFLQLEASGMRLASGAMVFAPDQVKRFRRAIDDGVAGEEFTGVCARLAEQGLPVQPGHQPVLQRLPAGYEPEHPRADVLRWKGAVVIKEYDRAGWMGQPGAIDRIRAVWSAAAPLKEWIDRNVGESAAPPSRRPR
jgi:uncharacterized protein (TIGR02453 family)